MAITQINFPSFDPNYLIAINVEFGGLKPSLLVGLIHSVLWPG